MTLAMFPSWYSEDWYWFQSIKNPKDFDFIPSRIVHHAGRKNILDANELKKEEIGKIFTLPLRRTDGLTRGVVAEYISFRVKVLQNITHFFDRIQKEKTLSRRVELQVGAVRAHLEDLRDFLAAMDPQEIVGQYKRFKRSETIWKRESPKLIGLPILNNAHSS